MDINYKDSYGISLRPREAFKQIFTDQAFLLKLKAYSDENKMPYDKCIAKSTKYLYEIAGNKTSSRIYWKLSKWITDIFIAKKFKKIISNKEGLEKIKEDNKNKIVVLISNHRSIFDFFILPYVFFNEIQLMPAILSGETFNKFIIGSLFRKWGAYYIRRGEKDPLYLLIFKYYIYTLTKKGVPNLFFIEGERSRDGSIHEPKKGILKWIIEANELFNLKKEVVFFPINITYDIVPELEVFIKENASGNKEDIRHSLKKYFGISKKYGNCYINIGDEILSSKINATSENLDKTALLIINEIKKRRTFTLVSLISWVLLSSKENVSVVNLRDRLNRSIKYANKKGINLVHVDVNDVDYYLELMKINAMIEINEDIILIKDRGMLEYYFNMISEVLGKSQHNTDIAI